MNSQRLACALVTIAIMALAGCGGGGGGDGRMSQMGGGGQQPTTPPAQQPGGGSMPDSMMGNGGSLPACAVGAISGGGCTHEGGGSSFTFTINDDGTACVGGICSGRSITINNFSARKNADGTWEITALPGQTPADDMMAGTSSSGFQVPNDPSITSGLSNAITRAARNAPSPGSVTQSSDGTNAVSDDIVGVNVTSENGQLMFDVFYDGTSIVNTARAQAATDVELILDRPKGTELFERVRGESWNGVEFYRSLSAGDAESGSAAGDLWVDVYTDYEGENDTDYLAGGIWVFAPDTATSLADYEFGAFVDGNDPFTSANVMPLTGTATYEGDATGVYSDRTEGRNYFFDALASLTANFGTNSGLGTIGGRLHTFEEDGEPVAGNPVLTLGAADITNANHGFFKGNTTMTFDGDTYTGKWGGQFYGNGQSDGRPGSVAGTFGGATANDDYSFVGAFGAYKQ